MERVTNAVDDRQVEGQPARGAPDAEAPEAKPDEPRVRVVDRRWWAQGESAEAATDAPSLKPTYVEELERQIADKDSLIQSYVTRYRAAMLEFDEARARFRREVAREVERGKRAFLAELLEVVDNLDRAIEAARGREDDPLRQGVELVRSQFLAKLEALGVQRIDAIGEPFDPARHDAVSAVPTDDPAQDHRVVGVIKPGYLIGDEVLRPASVAVARRTTA